MYKFEEFDNVEEVNAAAKEYLEAGRTNVILNMANDLGIDTEDAQAYIDGEEDTFTSENMLALAKIKTESAKLVPYEIMSDWITYINMCIVDKPTMAAVVIKKEKTLKRCIAEILKWSLKNAKEVDADILKECGIKHKVTLGIPGMATAKQIISKYYERG